MQTELVALSPKTLAVQESLYFTIVLAFSFSLEKECKEENDVLS
jgi:hypothetical protein